VGFDNGSWDGTPAGPEQIPAPEQIPVPEQVAAAEQIPGPGTGSGT
jgi:hypothetical protein